MKKIEEGTITTSNNHNALKKNRTIILSGRVDQEMSDKVVENFKNFVSESPIDDIYVYIDSYGGCMDNCFAIVDIFQESSCPVHTICIGKAMSAGSVILAAGTKGKRSITKHARVMVHELSSFSYGTFSAIEVDIIELRRLQKMMENFLIEVTGKSRKVIKEWMGQDTYMTAEQAVRNGIVDFIRKSK